MILEEEYCLQYKYIVETNFDFLTYIYSIPIIYFSLTFIFYFQRRKGKCKIVGVRENY